MGTENERRGNRSSFVHKAMNRKGWMGGGFRDLHFMPMHAPHLLRIKVGASRRHTLLALSPFPGWLRVVVHQWTATRSADLRCASQRRQEVVGGEVGWALATKVEVIAHHPGHSAPPAHLLTLCWQWPASLSHCSELPRSPGQKRRRAAWPTASSGRAAR